MIWDKGNWDAWLGEHDVFGPGIDFWAALFFPWFLGSVQEGRVIT